jgi:hypothetical protein
MKITVTLDSISSMMSLIVNFILALLIILAALAAVRLLIKGLKAAKLTPAGWIITAVIILLLVVGILSPK